MAFLDGLSSGVSGNGQVWLDAMQNIWLAVGVIFWGILGIGIMLVIWYFMSYNIPSHIYELVGSKDRPVLRFVGTKKIKIKTVKGVDKLFIFGVKKDFPVPDPKYFQLGTKGKMLNLLKSGNDFTPFFIEPTENKVVVSEADIRYWQSQSTEAAIKKYAEDNFMAKYGHMVLFFGGMAIIGFLYWMQLKSIDDDVGRITNAAQSMSDAIRGQVGNAP